MHLTRWSQWDEDAYHVCRQDEAEAESEECPTRFPT